MCHCPVQKDTESFKSWAGHSGAHKKNTVNENVFIKWEPQQVKIQGMRWEQMKGWLNSHFASPGATLSDDPYCLVKGSIVSVPAQPAESKWLAALQQHHHLQMKTEHQPVSPHPSPGLEAQEVGSLSSPGQQKQSVAAGLCLPTIGLSCVNREREGLAFDPHNCKWGHVKCVPYFHLWGIDYANPSILGYSNRMCTTHM